MMDIEVFSSVNRLTAVGCDMTHVFRSDLYWCADIGLPFDLSFS